MVFHIYVQSRCVFAYNDFTKKSSFFNLTKSIGDDVEGGLNEINNRVGNSHGQMFCQNPYSNVIRKKIIECGLKSGFQKVINLNLHDLLFLICLTLPNIVLQGNIVGLVDGPVIKIYKIREKRLEFIERIEWGYTTIRPEEIISKLDCRINVLFVDEENKYVFKLNPGIQKQYIGSTRVHYLSEQSYIDVLKLLVENSKNKPLYSPVLDYAIWCKLINKRNGWRKHFIMNSGVNLPLKAMVEIPLLNDTNRIEIDSISYDLSNYNKPSIGGYITIDENSVYEVAFPDLTESQQTQNAAEELRNGMKKLAIKSADLQNRRKTEAQQKQKTNQLNTPVFETYLMPRKIANYDSSINAVGIDLGTSRCCAAVNKEHGIETVSLDNSGDRLLPSYVAYNEEKFKFGITVVRGLRNYSDSSVFDVKRIIGKRLDEVQIDPTWPFEVQDFNGKAIIIVKRCGTTIRTLPERVSGLLLGFIKSKSEEFQGKPITQAVITVPATFNTAQKEDTKIAAQLAGFHPVNFLPEPVAAAFAYYIDHPIDEGSNFVVFDLGGGTLDVCIFKITNSRLQIISECGDSNLGGRDFDNVLVKYFKDKIKDSFGVTDFGKKFYKFMEECQVLKHFLSLNDQEQLDLDNVLNLDGTIPINRAEFESLSSDLLNRCRISLETALSQANLTQKEISKVLQVGGGSRMPMIKKLLKEMFPSAEHCSHKHPDEVVAIGAAYYAYSLQANSGTNNSLQLF